MGIAVMYLSEEKIIRGEIMCKIICRICISR